MAAAADEQEATLQEVARSLSEASAGVNSAASNVAAISTRAKRAEGQSRTVATVVQLTNQRVGNPRANLIVSLRSSGAGDRRGAEPRIPVKLSGTLKCNAASLPGTIVDISLTGLLFQNSGSDEVVREGGKLAVEIEKIGGMSCAVIAKSVAGVHLQFEDLHSDVRGRLESFIRSVEAVDQRFIEAARATLKEIAGAFEATVVQGAISMDPLFDPSYRSVPNTDRAQHLTAFVELCDRLLPEIQEPVLTMASRVVFCAAVDRNGYLPTQNRQCSNPQRADDPVWRIFNDRTGLSAARTVREHLLQTYDREMGDGVVVTLKEVDVPIQVRGRHWGAVRLAFRA